MQRRPLMNVNMELTVLITYDQMQAKKYTWTAFKTNVIGIRSSLRRMKVM